MPPRARNRFDPVNVSSFCLGHLLGPQSLKVFGLHTECPPRYILTKFHAQEAVITYGSGFMGLKRLKICAKDAVKQNVCLAKMFLCWT